MEGENPTRRYKWFRPRQAAAGTATVAATNYATGLLYNAGRGAFLLALRDFLITPSAANNFSVGAIQGLPTGAGAGTQQQLVATEALSAGLVYSVDSATFYSPYGHYPYAPVAGYGWPHEFPVMVVPPGWCAFIQAAVKALTVNFDFTWEAIGPDELDWMY